ncbi:MAG TPA: hypothetical protein VKF41_07895 [Bryobacteraceae bacterium]|nr:hypothetical protein [Bryobacteraceae bacterium]
MRKPSAILNHGLAIALLTALAAAAAPPAWTNREEYDLVLKIRVEASPQKQLELLNQWKKQYPQSEMRQTRRELFLSAYQASGDIVHMFETSREMLTEQPSNLVGVYWCALLAPEMKDTRPETLDVGYKAARQLQAGLDTYFAPGRKPEGMTDADWATRKSAAGLLARRAIGWVEWQRADLPAAEKTFTAYLQQDPNNAEIASWLGFVLASQNKPIPAAWQLFRVSSMHGEGALPEVWRHQVEDLAGRLYAAYHGGADGADKLKAAAAASPFPPAGFQVDSAEVVRQRNAEEALNQADPELAAWLRIYRQLSAPDGEKYFLDSLKPARIPKLRGTVIRCEPAGKPDTISLGLSSAATEEVVLKVSVPFAHAAEPGTQIHFHGAADAFVRDPFRLTVIAGQEDIDGWPDSGTAK